MRVRRNGLTATVMYATFGAALCAPPTTPTPPSPDPVPSPTPAPSAPPPQMGPLGVEGNKFVLGGLPAQFRGAVLCCDSPETVEDEGIDDGWPWVTEEALRGLAERGIWWTHARLGPFVPDDLGHASVRGHEVHAVGFRPGADAASHAGYRFHGYKRTESGLYDLSEIDAEYVARAKALTDFAARLGVVVEWDLVDAWPLKHGLSAWSFGRNVNAVGLGLNSLRTEPHPVMEAWIRAWVRALAPHSNVAFQVSNESFAAGPCEPRPVSGGFSALGFGSQSYCVSDWEAALIAVAREEMDALGVSRVIGSNAHLPVRSADYWAYHQEKAARAVGRPTLVNETGNLSADAHLANLRDAERAGTYYALWRGELSRAEWASLLERAAEFWGR